MTNDYSAISDAVKELGGATARLDRAKIEAAAAKEKYDAAVKAARADDEPK